MLDGQVQHAVHRDTSFVSVLVQFRCALLACPLRALAVCFALGGSPVVGGGTDVGFDVAELFA